MTIYLGKRDYVDHVDQVEPVGKLSLESGFLAGFPCSHQITVRLVFLKMGFAYSLIKEMQTETSVRGRCLVGNSFKEGGGHTGLALGHAENTAKGNQNPLRKQIKDVQRHFVREDVWAANAHMEECVTSLASGKCRWKPRGSSVLRPSERLQ